MAGSKAKIISCLEVHRSNDLQEQMRLFYLKNVLKYIGSIYNEEMFGLLLGYLSMEIKENLLKDSLVFAKRMKLDVKFIEECYRDGSSDLRETLTDLFRKWQLRKKFQHVCTIELEKIRITEERLDDLLRKRLSEIQTMFTLADLDAEILLLYYHVETDGAVNELVDVVNSFLATKITRYVNNLSVAAIAMMLGVQKSRVHRTLQNSAPLVRFAILDSDRDITPEIMQYLEGFSDRPVLQNYFNRYEGAIIPLADHFVAAQDIEIMRELFIRRGTNQGVNILLYGAPGTGKTEFVRSFSHVMQADLYQVHAMNASEDSKNGQDGTAFRLRAFTACQHTVEKKNAVILIDEADSLLNAIPGLFLFKTTGDKGQINSLLDESAAYTIWITNYIDGMDESTRRRFNYAVKFDKMGLPQRKKLWQYKIREYGLEKIVKRETADAFAMRYEMNAGGIDMTLRNLAALHAGGGKQRFSLVQLEKLAESYQVLVTGKSRHQAYRLKPVDTYTLDGLNIDADMERVMTTIKHFNQAWQADPTALAVPNLNLFLYGPPGTGKTEFVKYAAQILGRKLIIKRASDLLSPWVGMSERQICDAFEQAMREEAILFFDEVDSLLFSRENAGRAWEVSQVNELLTNMENFTGIFIAATNFKETVDTASLRRFALKLKFDYLTASGVMIFYRRYFPSLVKTPISKAEERQLQSIEMLTPGDFKVVYQKYMFLEKEELNHDMIIDALNTEVETKNEKIRRIGF